jgi:hypothetical protein
MDDSQVESRRTGSVPRHDLRIETRGTEPAYRPSQDPPEITVSTASSQRRDWFDLGGPAGTGPP